MKVPTIGHVRKAVEIARRGGRRYKGIEQKVTYDQNEWCGTSCCIWGHALLLAGNKQVVGDLLKANNLAQESRRIFVQKSRRHLALGYMMESSTNMVLRIVKELTGKKSVVNILERAAKSNTFAVSMHAEKALDSIR